MKNEFAISAICAATSTGIAPMGQAEEVAVTAETCNTRLNVAGRQRMLARDVCLVSSRNRLGEMRTELDATIDLFDASVNSVTRRCG